MTRLAPTLLMAILISAAAHAAWAQQQWNDPLPPEVEPEPVEMAPDVEQLLERIERLAGEITGESQQQMQQGNDPEPPPVIDDQSSAGEPVESAGE